MPIYYLSGPMTGKPGCNYDLFNEVEADLNATKLKRDTIINPARSFGGDRTRPRSDYMKLGIEYALKADVIVLLPGWKDSEGAMLEVKVARECGKEFCYAVKAEGTYWTYPEFKFIDVPEPPRVQSLQRAIDYISGDRNTSYGPPTQDFKRTADLWTAFGFHFLVDALRRTRPNALILLKQSRLAWQPEKADSWDDTSGYAGCGYECAVEEAK